MNTNEIYLKQTYSFIYDTLDSYFKKKPDA